jgi:DNA-binding NarL/FixJ family response regulator
MPPAKISALRTALLVEPNALFREGLGRILRGARFRIVSSKPSIESSELDALTSLKETSHKDMLLVIGCGADTSALTRQISLFKERRPSGRVAVVADCYTNSDAISAFRAGANAFLVKAASLDVFMKSLELVLLGETLVPLEILSLVPGLEYESAPRLEGMHETATPMAVPEEPHLSPQEMHILRHLVEGDSNKLIARKIDIAEATVKVHVKAILRKVRVRNRTEAAIWAVHNRSMTPGTENSRAAVTSDVRRLTHTGWRTSGRSA